MWDCCIDLSDDWISYTHALWCGLNPNASLISKLLRKGMIIAFGFGIPLILADLVRLIAYWGNVIDGKPFWAKYEIFRIASAGNNQSQNSPCIEVRKNRLDNTETLRKSPKSFSQILQSSTISEILNLGNVFILNCYLKNSKDDKEKINAETLSGVFKSIRIACEEKSKRNNDDVKNNRLEIIKSLLSFCKTRSFDIVSKDFIWCREYFIENIFIDSVNADEYGDFKSILSNFSENISDSLLFRALKLIKNHKHKKLLNGFCMEKYIISLLIERNNAMSSRIYCKIRSDVRKQCTSDFVKSDSEEAQSKIMASFALDRIFESIEKIDAVSLDRVLTDYFDKMSEKTLENILFLVREKHITAKKDPIQEEAARDYDSMVHNIQYHLRRKKK